MSRRIFITGTDTDIGKTYVSCQLLKMLTIAGHSTIGIKPVASGAIETEQGFQNQDALALQAASSIALEYNLINPILFKDPIAPHIAAERLQQTLTVDQLIKACAPVFNIAHDITIIEGVGGWKVPLNKTQTMADFVRALNLEVILVVGMRLGCLNHALLTVEAIKSMGVNLLGWIANYPHAQMLAIDENLQSLVERIDAPLLSTIPYRGAICATGFGSTV